MAFIKEVYRKYANAFEIAILNEDTEETAGGYSDIIRKDTELLKQVLEMVENRNNQLGKAKSILLMKHKKPSVRDLCDKIQKGEPFEVVDRTTITL